MIAIPESVPEWLAKALRKHTVEEGDCLIWTGWLSYGSPKVVHAHWRELGLRTKGVSVRRELTEAIKGRPMRKRMFAMTTCCDERCVNPAHLVASDEERGRSLGLPDPWAQDLGDAAAQFTPDAGDRGGHQGGADMR